MTRYGETNGYTASQHVAQIVRYGGKVPVAVLAHRGKVPSKPALKNDSKESHPVGLDTEALYGMGVKVVKTVNMMSANSIARHDPDRTAESLDGTA